MANIKISVASISNEKTNSLVDLLKKNPYPNSDNTLIIVSELNEPTRKPCITYTLEDEVTTLKYQLDRDDQVKDVQALMHFASGYTQFTQELLKTNPNLTKDLDEDSDEDSDSFSFEFFSSKTNSSSGYQKNAFNSHDEDQKKAQYYFMAGLGLCATGSMLLIFAPSFLAITAFVLAIGLLGMAFYHHKNQDFSGDFLPCSM